MSPEVTEASAESRLMSAVKEVVDEIRGHEAEIKRADEAYEADVRKARQEHEDARRRADEEYTRFKENRTAEHNKLKEEKLALIKSLRGQLGEFVKVIQEHSGVAAPHANGHAKHDGQPKPPPSRKNKSVRQLVVDYIDHKRQTPKPQFTSKELRDHLLTLGKTRNPGVELNKLVKNKILVRKARGEYVPAKK